MALHVVFGAGQVGPRLAELLLSEGRQVRVVKRTPVPVPAEVELVLGDASDPVFCGRAAAGAAVVYHCMNPPYSLEAWARFVPLYMSNLMAAASGAGARLVVLDNLYMYGRTGGQPIHEETPVHPSSRKGEVRARAAAMLLDAHRRGEVQAVIGRASDYWGPGGRLTHFGDQFWPRVLAGKSGQFIFDPDVEHTYHYIPDVARGLVALGAAEADALGRVWMLPCHIAAPTRAVVGRLAAALGREIRITRIPRIAIKAFALVRPIVAELDEMLYQWEEPFIVDDSRFRARFATEPISLDEAAGATLAWARSTYGKEPAGA